MTVRAFIHGPVTNSKSLLGTSSRIGVNRKKPSQRKRRRNVNSETKRRVKRRNVSFSRRKKPLSASVSQRKPPPKQSDSACRAELTATASQQIPPPQEGRAKAYPLPRSSTKPIKPTTLAPMPLRAFPQNSDIN